MPVVSYWYKDWTVPKVSKYWESANWYLVRSGCSEDWSLKIAWPQDLLSYNWSCLGFDIEWIVFHILYNYTTHSRPKTRDVIELLDLNFECVLIKTQETAHERERKQKRERERVETEDTTHSGEIRAISRTSPLQPKNKIFINWRPAMRAHPAWQRSCRQLNLNSLFTCYLTHSIPFFFFFFTIW